MRTVGLWLVSFFLAATVWFVVSAPRREQVLERAYAAPLSVIAMPRALAITNQVPDTVNVRLRGRVSALRSLSSQNLEVTVDVSWAQPGEAAITLRPEAIAVPPGVEVVSIDPNRLHFHIEQVRQKIVRIRPFIIGDPRNGFRIGDTAVMPDQALISGPASQVRNVNEVTTERIIMAGRTESFTQNVGVVSDSASVHVLDPQSVQVVVPVLPEIGPTLPTDTQEPATSSNTGTEKPR